MASLHGKAGHLVAAGRLQDRQGEGGRRDRRATGRQYDANLKTEIELRLIPDGKNGTRVELEHRRLDRYGARRDEMRAIFDTQGD